MTIQSRWLRDKEIPPPPVSTETTTNRPVIATLLPIPRDYANGGRLKNGGRPPRQASNPDVIERGRRQVTSFYLHGDLYDRMKAYLRSVGLSQTEWLEYLIRTELARRGFDQPPPAPEPTVTSTASDATAAPTTNPAPSPTPNAKPKKAASKKRSKKRKKPAKVKAAPVDGGAKG